MPKRKPAHYQGNDGNGKKQRKRLRRIAERLQEAKEALKRAEERLQRAETRIQKRRARVQLLEEHLAAMHLQPGAQAQMSMGNRSEQAIGRIDEEATTADEAINRARQARAITQATEQAVREAIERAQTTTRLEQLGGDHHLAQEPEHLEAEAERAGTITQTTTTNAKEAERLLIDVGIEVPVEPAEPNEEHGEEITETKEGEDDEETLKMPTVRPQQSDE